MSSNNFLTFKNNFNLNFNGLYLLKHNKFGFFLETNENSLHNLLFILRDSENCLFKLLIDILVIDYPGNNKRFCLIYCLLSLKYNVRLNVKLYLNEFTSVSSCANIYKSACWLEREVWDMSGLFFEKHPDLRRILTDYGFEGFPLRKDFPLSGYKEVRYDDSQKRVISENIEMAQEYRVFNFKSSWE